MLRFISLAADQISLSPLPKVGANQNWISLVLTIVFGLVGALSVLFIVIGGLRYVIANGDSQSIAKAKGTIIFALIGLVVAIAAQAIVIFVVNNLS